jgi:PTS system fructose-specific IIA component
MRAGCPSRLKVELTMSYTFPQAHAVVLDVDCPDRGSLIRQLVATLADCPDVVDLDSFARQLIRREVETPTGLENGCALPHARSAAVEEIVLVVGRSLYPIDFGAADGPARLFFLFGVPEHCITQYLKLVAKLSTLLKSESFRRRLLEAKSESEMREILEEGRRS